jgi:hypothetical protein
MSLSLSLFNIVLSRFLALALSLLLSRSRSLALALALSPPTLHPSLPHLLVVQVAHWWQRWWDVESWLPENRGWGGWDQRSVDG